MTKKRGDKREGAWINPEARSREPTEYPELNAVLAEFLASVEAVLVENLVGAYLTGSFALGDADKFSDVDFLIVTHSDVTEHQSAALQAMHKRIHGLAVDWAQHLEGSYAPTERLRSLEGPPRAFLFLDNGASELEWDNHCNTAVTRWVLREHGVVLAGPDPKTLIDPVSTDQLRREAVAGVREYGAWAPEPTNVGAMNRWKQTYLVVTFCRLLQTLASGDVTSKREAGTWAMKSLAPEWSGLIQRALDDRPDPWRRVHQLADTDAVSRTLAFADYALRRAAGGPGTTATGRIKGTSSS